MHSTAAPDLGPGPVTLPVVTTVATTLEPVTILYTPPDKVFVPTRTPPIPLNTTTETVRGNDTGYTTMKPTLIPLTELPQFDEKDDLDKDQNQMSTGLY